jgi:hypothetical protein
MATEREMQTWQRFTLYQLLKLQALNLDISVEGLADIINEQLAIMDDKDIAIVTQRIQERYGKK